MAELTPADHQNLERSYIDADLAQRARIFRVDSEEGARLVGQSLRARRDFSGLAIPYYWPGEEKARGYCLRRDRPEWERKNGELHARDKYLGERERPNRIYFPPETFPEDLVNPATRAYVVEGEKKALALDRYLRERGERALVIGLAGVWAWRGTVGKVRDSNGHTVGEEKGPIPDLSRLEWSGREAVILFDANVHANTSVQAARAGLTRDLAGREARALWAELPADCGVNGVDDLLGLGRFEDVAQMLSSASAPAAQKGEDRAILEVSRMNEVVAEEVEWLWYPYVALGKITMVAGDMGEGKGYFTCAAAAAIAAGYGLPGMAARAGGDSLFFFTEDGLADTFRPRLDAQGCDVGRVYAVNQTVRLDDKGLLAIEELIVRIRPTLLVIDPITAYLGSGVDMHRANQTRPVLDRLARLGERHACALLIVIHFNKAEGKSQNLLHRLLGSVDFPAVARSVLAFGHDPRNRLRRVMFHLKNNLGPQGEAQGFELQPVPGNERMARFFWTGVSDLQPEDVFGSSLGARSAEAEGKKNQLDEACEFLEDLLARHPRYTSDIKSVYAN